MNNFVITLGRQLGSGGKLIAEKLADLLNIPVYDKKLLEVAARESGLDTTVFEGADERESDSFFGGVFSIHGSISNIFSGTGSCMESDRLFLIQSEAIQRIAEKESCIIIGRCAEYVLRDHPNMLSIYITADSHDRITRIAKNELVSDERAKELMERGDKKRRSYHDYYATTHWGDAQSYDLCINSSRLGIDGTVDFLHKFIKSRFEL